MAQPAQIIGTEWRTTTEEYTDGDIETHAKGASLIGIWSNKTVQKLVKVLTEKKKWTEELAMERVKDLAFINMKGAVQVDTAY